MSLYRMKLFERLAVVVFVVIGVVLGMLANACFDILNAYP